MEEQTKGTVTSLSSMFPVDEAQKAAKRVEDTVAEKQKELDDLKEFIADNTNLINLVSRLPDELHHDVMVPFGKAAFFPGRLVHTNEFMVLLGEGYYVERTAKQTVEILKRRGKVLDSQVESLKANIKDLRAEASFFDFTAYEAAEGLVEIREDYVEESSGKGKSKSEKNDDKVVVDNDEFARIMSRLDELEKEELAVEGDNENDVDEYTRTAESDNESDEDQLNNTVESDDECHEDEHTDMPKRGNGNYGYEPKEAKLNHFTSQNFFEMRKPQKQTKVGNVPVQALSNMYDRQLDINDKPDCTGLTVQSLSKVVSSDHKSDSKPLSETKESIPSEKSLLFPEVKEKVKTVSSTRNETPERTPKQGFDSSKAFTGSIVERTVDLPNSQQKTVASSESSNPQPSKPVSRFKMQRR
ncbi:RNA polymerase II subunit 5-mediating protein homolog isoform X1 [Jatropha curcas]|uniref:RNA polymerase II subunit 5-mediating protein homolog isoform X1 n=1 Tax=Jatropha curcas TaxID=180498 RepID=UPI0005FB60B8|nr:RNA polymerase II subunit 5-mediating protein homolog isoform X1 [Jatropha curcas]